MSKKHKSSGSAPMMDQKYEAESDARTLAEAQAIREDKPRATRAVKAAKNIANEAQKNLGRTTKAVGRKK